MKLLITEVTVAFQESMESLCHDLRQEASPVSIGMGLVLKLHKLPHRSKRFVSLQELSNLAVTNCYFKLLCYPFKEVSRAIH